MAKKIEFFTDKDKKDWELFRSQNRTKITRDEFAMICELHAKYYNHPYHQPCTCNPNTIKTWIRQLNDVYERNNND